MIETLLYFVLPLLGSVFILTTIFNGMKSIGTNITVSASKKNLILTVYMLITLLLSFTGNGLVNLITLLFIPLLGHYLYNSLRLYVIYYTGFVVALYLTDILSILLLQLLFQAGIIYLINKTAYYMVLIITIRFVEFMVLKILVNVIRRRQKEQITRRQMFNSFLLPMFSIINLFSMMYFMQVYPSESSILLFEINIALLIGLNIYFTSVFDIITRNTHLENELNLYVQQQVIQSRYYENLEQKYDNTRKLVHDIRNHILAMEHLYMEQQNLIGCQYTKDVHEILNQLGQKYYTSCKILNIILNDKVQIMQAHGIEADIKISEVDLSFIREVDITTLFANILDNAIEAAADSQDKRIILRVVMVHDFISINLKNSMLTEPVKAGTGFQSTKISHEGLGLKNVERVITNYKGDVQYEWREQYFITRIMLGL
ncbi:GHKL domain-containing protein [Anaerocolumna sp. AGMB13020]|uniref:ATP-binding protein n=1 Tax=Anaerocolumna sp. AGMB13020 TaxID=3081750 RepID=UPI00295314F3|nr:GHKL domain-containing protein [Anaerocolumna sp. AGMB13020]WOO38151.1 GHKL domain-containing protein [Anaerocolumna sp. AGMB13020]